MLSGMEVRVAMRKPLRIAALSVGTALAALLLAACGGSAPARTANLRWTAAACERVLSLRNALHRDGTSLNLSFGPQARIDDAITAARRLVRGLEGLGLPPMERRGGRTQLRVPSAGSAADLALAAAETGPCRTLAADSLSSAFG
jgi:hypothetical protein